MDELTNRRASDRLDTKPSLLLRVTALLMLSGFLLFAHGCHGDEDNELFARIITIVTGK